VKPGDRDVLEKVLEALLRVREDAERNGERA
jgi:hypothetical protein